MAAPRAETDDNEDSDRSDAQWQRRAIVMVAALAARDHEGPDRDDIVAWCTAILDEAAAEALDDISARGSDQIYSNSAAIAALGYLGLYRRDRNPVARDALFALAARQDHAVATAIGSHLPALQQLDPRLPRSFVRLMIQSASHPRRSPEPGADAANMEMHRNNKDAAIDAEKQWLEGSGSEPGWPRLPPWHSRHRRSFRIGSDVFEDEERPAEQVAPDMYVDEQVLGILVNSLVPFTIGSPDEWLIALARHLARWTIEANNGPPGDDEHERENRPSHWNMCYFDFLGILSETLSFADGRSWFMESITTLHDEACNDAIASFLRGFDRAVLATDMPEPDDAAGVRALFAEQLQRGRMASRLNYHVSFSAESHLGDALTAMFYQPSRWSNHRGPYIPSRWSGLLETMPILASLAASVPKSGYVALLFLATAETFPCAALLPDAVRVVSAWCGVHAAGTQFWTEYQIGHRLCVWIDQALNDERAVSEILPRVHDELSRCLDILVRSGVASARTLEGRIAEELCVERAV